MDITIRQQTRYDYAEIARISNACMPDYPTSEAEMRRADEVRDSKCRHNRLIAERDGLAIGVAYFGNIEWMYHPQRFEVFIQVHPEHRRQGVGSQLYDAMECDLASVGPEVLRSFVKEDILDGVRFLEKRGFREFERDCESRLDVEGFDPSPYSGIEDCLQSIGVEIVTFGSLANDRDRDRKMHVLETELVHDLPAPEPLTDLSYEQYRKHVLDSPNLLPDGWMVATHNGEYIGVSVVWKKPGEAFLETGLTAVKREWRRKGIALAMKLRVIDYARREGYGVIRTDNESNNVGMLSINERLGFVKQPAWIGYVKELQ